MTGEIKKNGEHVGSGSAREENSGGSNGFSVIVGGELTQNRYVVISKLWDSTMRLSDCRNSICPSSGVRQLKRVFLHMPIFEISPNLHPRS